MTIITKITCSHPPTPPSFILPLIWSYFCLEVRPAVLSVRQLRLCCREASCLFVRALQWRSTRGAQCFFFFLLSCIVAVCWYASYGSGMLWCVSRITVGSPQRPLLGSTVLLLSHTDKSFTPRQRRLLGPEQHLSALAPASSPSSLCFPFLLMFPCQLHIQSLVQNPRIFLHCVKKRIKNLSFYCNLSLSLLCSFLFFLSNVLM